MAGMNLPNKIVYGPKRFKNRWVREIIFCLFWINFVAIKVGPIDLPIKNPTTSLKCEPNNAKPQIYDKVRIPLLYKYMHIENNMALGIKLPVIIIDPINLNKNNKSHAYSGFISKKICILSNSIKLFFL